MALEVLDEGDRILAFTWINNGYYVTWLGEGDFFALNSTGAGHGAESSLHQDLRAEVLRVEIERLSTRAGKLR